MGALGNITTLAASPSVTWIQIHSSEVSKSDRRASRTQQSHLTVSADFSLREEAMRPIPFDLQTPSKTEGFSGDETDSMKLDIIRWQVNWIHMNS